MRLIDADAAVEQSRNDEYMWAYDLTDLEEFLTLVPTIDPESLRPKGRWVDPKWNDMWQSMTATCSHCLERGEVRVRTNERGMKVINSPSCPQCGAKMSP